MIFLYIYIVLSILSVITGVLFAIYGFVNNINHKSPWYYDIYVGFVIPFIPLLFLCMIFYILYKGVITGFKFI